MHMHNACSFVTQMNGIGTLIERALGLDGCIYGTSAILNAGDLGSDLCRRLSVDYPAD